MDYQILSSSTVVTLTFKVRMMINKGYQAQGGVSVTTTNLGNILYTQAVILIGKARKNLVQ